VLSQISVTHIRATKMILLIQLQKIALAVDRHLNFSNLKYKLSYMFRYEWVISRKICVQGNYTCRHTQHTSLKHCNKITLIYKKKKIKFFKNSVSISVQYSVFSCTEHIKIWVQGILYYTFSMELYYIHQASKPTCQQIGLYSWWI